MTAARTTRSPDPAAARPRLSPVQITASALAAVSSAVVASFFGVAGTVIGAALASVVTTVSAALYSESLRRTGERLRRGRGGHGPAAAPATRVASRAGGPLPSSLDPRRAPARRGPRWGRVGVSAVAVFAVAMAVLTAVELLGQRPVSALVTGAHEPGTTTIGALTHASSQRASTEAPGSGGTAPATPGAGGTPSSGPTAGSSAAGSTAASSGGASAAPSATTSAGPTSAAGTPSASAVSSAPGAADGTGAPTP